MKICLLQMQNASERWLEPFTIKMIKKIRHGDLEFKHYTSTIQCGCSSKLYLSVSLFVCLFVCLSVWLAGCLSQCESVSVRDNKWDRNFHSQKILHRIQSLMTLKRYAFHCNFCLFVIVCMFIFMCVSLFIQVIFGESFVWPVFYAVAEVATNIV